MPSVTDYMKRFVVLGVLLVSVIGLNASFASTVSVQEETDNKHPLLFPTRTPSGQFIRSDEDIIRISGTGAGVAISPDEAFLYVTVENDRGNPGNFEVINLSKGASVRRVDTPPVPEQIFVTSDGGQAYIKHFDRALSVVNLETLEVTALDFGVEEHDEIVLSPNAELGYISTFEDSILVIDLATNTLSRTIPYEASGGISGMVFSKDASQLFISNAITQTFSAVDVENFEIIYEFDVPGLLSDMVMTPDEQKALILNRNADGGTVVTFVDLVNRQVSSDVLIFSFERNLKLSPDGKRAYTTNASNNWLSVIDVENEVYLGPAYKVGDGPVDVVVASDSKQAYVASLDNTVTRVDLTLATEEDMFYLDVPTGRTAEELAITSDGSRALVSTFGNSVIQIDLTTNKGILPAIPIGDGTGEIVISPDGTRAAIRDFIGSRLTIVDLSSNEPLFVVDPGGSGIAMAPDKNVVYAENRNTISAIDLDTGKIIETLSFDERFFRIFMGTDPNTVYTFSNQSTNTQTLYVVDLTSETIQAEIAINKDARQVVFTPDQAKAYVLNHSRFDSFESSITAVDLIAHQVLAEIPLDEETQSIAITPDGSQVYAPHPESGTISVIDTTIDSKIGHSIFVGGKPKFIAITPDGQKAYWTQDFEEGVSSLDLGRALHLNGPNPDEFFAAKIRLSRFTDSLSFNEMENRLYASHADGVSAIDTTSESIVGSNIDLDTLIEDVAVVPGKNKLLVVDDLFGGSQEHLFFVDLETSKVTAQIPIGESLDDKSIAVSNDGVKAYVGNDGSGNVAIFAIDKEKKLGDIFIGSVEQVIADPVRPRIYVLRTSDLSVIDTQTDTEIEEIDIPGLARNMDISADGSTLYYVTGFDELRTIDLNTLEVSPEVLLFSGAASDIKVNQAGTRAYVSNFGNLSVSVLDLENMRTLAELPVGFGRDIVITADESKAYIATDQVRVIDLEALLAAILNSP